MLERIKELIRIEELSSGGFADEIGVQRSSLSHILNGRNNPSLDFAIKTLQRFPRINPDWFLHGTGEMYKHDSYDDNNDIIIEQQEDQPHDLFSAMNVNSPVSDEKEIQDIPLDLPVNEGVNPKSPDRYVSQILIFYSDSTYGVYKPQK